MKETDSLKKKLKKTILVYTLIRTATDLLGGLTVYMLYHSICLEPDWLFAFLYTLIIVSNLKTRSNINKSLQTMKKTKKILDENT